MWIPASETEIANVVTSGTLTETATFDAKRELPIRSRELAKDVAAMANDGGVIVYGVGEDANRRLTILNPFPLAGAAERVSSIVRTCISEPPTINILPIQSKNDPLVGYLAVVVPPSPRAPHMVIVDGDMRFYGRTATGNTPLPEGEIARLYERRRRWEIDLDGILDGTIREAPVKPDEHFAYLHLVIRPVIPDDQLLDRARGNERVPSMLNTLLGRMTRIDVLPTKQSYYPYFVEQRPWYRLTDGWATYFGVDPKDRPVRKPDEAFDLQVKSNGGGRLFCYRAAEHHDGQLLFFEVLIADMTARFLSFFGDLYSRAPYLGPVDIGIAITGLKGAIPSREQNPVLRRHLRPLEIAEYRRIERIPAASLLHDYSNATKSLVMPLIDAVYQGTYDPFALPER